MVDGQINGTEWNKSNEIEQDAALCGGRQRRRIHTAFSGIYDFRRGHGKLVGCPKPLGILDLLWKEHFLDVRDKLFGECINIVAHIKKAISKVITKPALRSILRNSRTTALGRSLPLKIACFGGVERPLMMKAAGQ